MLTVLNVEQFRHLRQLVSATHQLHTCRLILLAGLPKGFVASLSISDKPLDQILLDIIALNETPRLTNLNEAPLQVWLRNVADYLQSISNEATDEFRLLQQRIRAPEPILNRERLGSRKGNSVFVYSENSAVAIEERPSNIVDWRLSNVPFGFPLEATEDIEAASRVVADISTLNFNTAFAVGLAIGLSKELLLVRRSGLASHEDSAIGIFETLQVLDYEGVDELQAYLSSNLGTLVVRGAAEVDMRAPIFQLSPRRKGDFEIRLRARIKKARLRFRSFDPEEQGRMSANTALEHVRRSLGVVVPLLGNRQSDAFEHNIRAAFVAGLARGLGKQSLVLQSGEDPVPLQYCDRIASFKFLDQIDSHIAEFAAEITDLLQSTSKTALLEPQTFLGQLRLGASCAENEFAELGEYYLETDQYQRALRGEGRVVVGRKGSGKTALFVQVRDRARQHRSRVVLDLRPEGFQLQKLKDSVMKKLKHGTQAHTLTAFWEYLLLLEVCHKLLQTDRRRHTRDRRLYEAYQSLARAYSEDEYVSEGDFAERMSQIVHRISADFIEKVPSSASPASLMATKATEFLYKHDIVELRSLIFQYLLEKDGLWILFDNLDKGWPAAGVEPEDVTILRCLVDASYKLERALRKRRIECHILLFLRNDVYELLVENTPDRGKVSKLRVDWTDPDLLREMLRRRIARSVGGEDTEFEEIWRQVCVSHVEGEESSQYLVDRCLMRPRCLLDLLQQCRSHAVSLGHRRIELDDIERGEEVYSTDLVAAIHFELRDVRLEAADLLYELAGSAPRMSASEFELLLPTSTDGERDDVVTLMLWYGVIGFCSEDDDPQYIYDVSYDMRVLKALMRKTDDLHYFVNPAFWKGLRMRTDPL